jgi:Family of unknown function (DUF6452)
MKMKLVNRIFSIVIVLVALSCTSESECRQELAVKLKIGLYTIDKQEPKSLSIDSVWVNGFAKDSFLYKNSKNVNAIKLPLNAANEQSDFIIQFNNIKDTISISYTSNPAYFLSLACGCIATHTINEVWSTSHFIDSIHIIQPEVLNYDAEQIRIYHN